MKQENGVGLVPKELPSQRVAEKVIGATDAQGVMAYLIKWQGIDEADFVPSQEVRKMCPQTIIDFYEERLEWKPNSRKDNSAQVNGVSLVPKDWPSQRVAVEIIGATEAQGALAFLIRWMGIDKADLVLSQEARKMCPQIVIDFYEERLGWKPFLSKNNTAI